MEPKTKRRKLEDFNIIKRDDLNISSKTIFTVDKCRELFCNLEKELEYLTGDLATVKVFGKVYDIPRKQAAYGDDGVKYRYSGTTIPAKPWTETLSFLRDKIEEHTGILYNFVLV
ncbi:DNA oxidative demethylase ALKBH2 [Eurytemora carolleeae]|uniref:DNA oxidative demethylase ALKBH2 n=1 Tax=Eurytemora carolleeae TaxID=1294199 RepID=UPI000C7681BA|nr:DNA oxidative demethylase ALKBH2 [Eurytemora carolleeae]|eukprot:XP_023331423.1 DNA oxidative demethylase ALKBH2-like [Eurytemora affinis]